MLGGWGGTGRRTRPSESSSSQGSERALGRPRVGTGASRYTFGIFARIVGPRGRTPGPSPSNRSKAARRIGRSARGRDADRRTKRVEAHSVSPGRGGAQDGRLSGRSSTRAIVRGSLELDRLPDPVRSWTALGPQARRLFAGGLREPVSTERLVLLHPRTWKAASFDSVRQETTRVVLDAEGHALSLSLAFDEAIGDDGLRDLERFAPRPRSTVLAELLLRSGEIVCVPISFITDGEVHCLGLDGDHDRRRRAGRNKQRRDASSTAGDRREPSTADSATDGAEDAPDLASIVPDASTSGLGALLGASRDDLHAVAEVGVRASRESALSERSQRLRAWRLETVAASMDRLADALRAARRGADGGARSAGHRLLEAYWVVDLAVRDDVVTRACSAWE